MGIASLIKRAARKMFGIQISKVGKTISHKVGISKKEKLSKYISDGFIPWSDGYWEYRWDYISKIIANESILKTFEKHEPLPLNYGKGLDDRSVEYPWVFSHLKKNSARFLDAGSTFNFPEIINHSTLEKKEKTITTFFPEKHNFSDKRISYVYADLRELPFRDCWFDEIVCQSTLEHIDMDNSMYGYEIKNVGGEKQKSYEYMKVIHELLRILQKDGMLLMTFPYGKFENHGFFQQFDHEMVDRIIGYMNVNGKTEIKFLKYLSNGWAVSSQEDCEVAISYNPHTGIGKGEDGAAHSRAICCLKFIKEL